MARRKNKKKTPKHNAPIPEEVTPRLRWHLRCLKLGSADEYLPWCRKHGYEAKLAKTNKVLRRELEDWQRRTAIAALSRSRGCSNSASVLARLCRGTMDASLVPLRLQGAAERIAAAPGEARAHLGDLLLLLGRRGRFLMDTRRFGERSYPYLDAAISLAARRREWIRDPHAWRPRTHNAARQFTSLTRHLIADYPVPPLLEAAWFRDDALAPRMRDWYVHLARGGNLRTADTPIRITKRVAHCFAQAPDDLSVEAALRWGQVRALGGGGELASAIAKSPIAASLEHDAFWQSVMRFLIQQPDLAPTEVGPIVDYIRFRKFEPTDVVCPDGRVQERPPPHPGFSMRHRTLRPLRAAVRRWHRMLSHTTGPARLWDAADIRGYEERTGSSAKGTLRCWRIEELRSSKALVHEGHALGHCVAAYANWCARGHASIWSLTLEVTGSLRRMQTIEINKHKTIVQCRGKHNHPPTQRIRSVILRWATREGIATGVLL